MEYNWGMKLQGVQPQFSTFAARVNPNTKQIDLPKVDNFEIKPEKKDFSNNSQKLITVTDHFADPSVKLNIF